MPPANSAAEGDSINQAIDQPADQADWLDFHFTDSIFILLTGTNLNAIWQETNKQHAKFRNACYAWKRTENLPWTHWNHRKTFDAARWQPFWIWATCDDAVSKARGPGDSAEDKDRRLATGSGSVRRANPSADSIQGREGVCVCVCVDGEVGWGGGRGGRGGEGRGMGG